MRPLRLVPRRTPSFGAALAVSLAAVAGAILVRMLFLGAGRGLGLSVTYFPAFIVATLFGGLRWGLAALAVTLLLGLAAPSAFASGSELWVLMGMFAVSALVTIAVTAGFRTSLMRLEAARAEREATQAELDRTQARLAMAQEAGGVGLWDWDLTTDTGYWSRTAFRNLGVDPSLEPAMDLLMQALHPDDREPCRRWMRTTAESGRMESFEHRVVHPDGSVRWLLSRGEVLRDDKGRPVRAVGVNIDVTERRLAFEQMRQSEERFRLLADSAPVLLWVSRTDGRREFANRAYVEFQGGDYQSAIDFDWRNVLHPDDLDRILKEQVAGEASRRLFTLEARYRRHDGEYRWIRSVSQPRWSPTGEFAGFIGIGYDITDAKRAEADLVRINDLLSERVQAALAERDEAEAALRRAQKLEAVGQLTGGVAHDFNNLLTVVIGALDLIQRNPGDQARAERMVEAALGAARRGERLTQQLLAFSRRQALKPQMVRVDDLLRESEPLLRRAVGEAVSFSVTPAAPGAVAHVDPAQFEAAVMNLVVNARDATPSGGTIRVESLRCHLKGAQVEEVEEGDYVCVVVHDTGSGMDAATAGRVFEPFFTTKEPGKGTGLGLSQVYGFARQSGGGVAIDSAPAKGATVRIYLPLAKVEAPAPPPEEHAAAPPAPVSGPGLTVLLVEDDAAVGDLVEAMLADLGHQVVRAAAPDEALRRLARPDRLDLLLTDVVMPGGKTGVDLAREATALRPQLPVILSSGYAGEALSGAGEAPWPLLRKPYDSAALAAVIAEVTRAAEPV